MTVYAAMSNGMLIGQDGEYRLEETFSDSTLETVAAHPDRPQRAFVGTFADGVWRTTDGGQHWERVGTETVDPQESPEHARRRGLEAGDVSAMAVGIAPSTPDHVWVGTEPSAVFRSVDGGGSWSSVGGIDQCDSRAEWAFPPRPFTHHVRWIAVHPTDPQRVYVAIEAGALLVTPDAGARWIERPPGSRRDNHALAVTRKAPNRVYSAAGDGYAESRDGGREWHHPQRGLDHRYVYSVAVDPGDPDRVLVSSASGPRQAHTPDQAESYVYRSVGTVEDRAWERLEHVGLPVGSGVTRPILRSGSSAGVFYAISNEGLYRTDSAGDAWRSIDTPWPERFEHSTARGIAIV